MALVSELMSLGMPARIAIVVSLLFLAGAVLATFLPSNATTGTTCGTWVAPEFNDAEVEKLMTDARELYGKAQAMGDQGSAGQAARIAATVRQAADECDETLAARRIWALSLLGLAVIGPASVLFIGGRQQHA